MGLEERNKNTVIQLLVCDCGGAEPLARSVLKSAGVQDWLKIPIARGRQKATAWLDSLPDNLKRTPEYQALQLSLKSRGKFSIVVGFTTVDFKWADVGSGKINEKLDGEVIAKHFEHMV